MKYPFAVAEFGRVKLTPLVLVRVWLLPEPFVPAARVIAYVAREITKVTGVLAVA